MSHLIAILAQTTLLLLLAPLLSGCIKNWKAKLQNRHGPRIWQPYFDLLKFLRKDMVISEHASWVFRGVPGVLFISTLLAGLMVPMVSAAAPLSLFGGALAFVGLLALGRFFLALGGLDPASAFGGMGSSREMTVAAIAEPALMLAIFTVAITAGSTDLSRIVETTHGSTWKLLNPFSVTDIETVPLPLSELVRSAARPPQPVRNGWSGTLLCHCTCWSLCENNCGGSFAVPPEYWAFVVGSTSVPTLASSAAWPELKSVRSSGTLGCKAHERPSDVFGVRHGVINEASRSAGPPS